MDAPLNPASIAISISMTTSLLAGFVSIWVAMKSANGPAANRDTTVSIMFGSALFLILLNGIAAALIAGSGMSYLGLAKAALMLTAAFAVVGMVIGLMRGLRSGRAMKLRSGRAIKTQSA